MHPFMLHGSQVRPHAEPALYAGQVGLMNGWGVFSTIRAQQGVLFEFHRHWLRMNNDAELLGVSMPCAEEEMEARLGLLLEANQAPNATVRAVVVRNHGGMWEGRNVEEPSTLLAFSAPLRQWEEAVELAVQPNARFAACEFSGCKVLSWAMNLTWLERARARGFDEVILLNENGDVSECTSANIFAKFGRELLTPPLSSGCLPGITRQLLLEEIAVDGVHVQEAALTVKDLMRSDACFISSSTRDIIPIRSIEGKAVAQDRAFTRLCKDAFARYMDEYIRAHRAS